MPGAGAAAGGWSPGRRRRQRGVGAREGARGQAHPACSRTAATYPGFAGLARRAQRSATPRCSAHCTRMPDLPPRRAQQREPRPRAPGRARNGGQRGGALCAVLAAGARLLHRHRRHGRRRHHLPVSSRLHGGRSCPRLRPLVHLARGPPTAAVGTAVQHWGGPLFAQGSLEAPQSNAAGLLLRPCPAEGALVESLGRRRRTRDVEQRQGRALQRMTAVALQALESMRTVR